MKDTDYAYCVARLRACESEILTADELVKLAQTNDYNKAVHFLKEKKWIENGENIKDFLDYQNNKLWSLLCESMPNKNELNVFCILNDFYNIKVAVKCLISHKEPDVYFVKPTTLDLENIRQKLRTNELFNALEENSAVAEKAYNVALRTENAQYADIILDRAALEYLLSHSCDNKCDISSEICDFMCDSSNMKIALRCAALNKDKAFVEEAISECRFLNREMLIEKAQEGVDELHSYLETTVYSDGAEVYRNNLSGFEKWRDKRILEIGQKASYTAFGFAPVCNYYYKKSFEIKTVGFILNGLLSGVSQKRIMERVAENYV